MKQLVVDTDLCISCSLCVDLAPDVFELTAEGLSSPREQAPAESAALREAMTGCPVACICWQE